MNQRFNNHHIKVRRIPGNYIHRQPQQPIPRLAIGDGEVMFNVPLGIKYKGDTNFSPLVKPVRTQEELNTILKGQKVDPDSFPKTGYMGEGVYSG